MLKIPKSQHNSTWYITKMIKFTVTRYQYLLKHFLQILYTEGKRTVGTSKRFVAFHFHWFVKSENEKQMVNLVIFWECLQ